MRGMALGHATQVADCLMPIRRSPTFVPVGPVCTQIAGGFERACRNRTRASARSTSQPASSARSIVPASTMRARIARWRRRCHRCPPASSSGLAGAQPRATLQRQMRIAAAAAMARRQLDGRFAAPDQSIGIARAQRRDEAPRVTAPTSPSKRVRRRLRTSVRAHAQPSLRPRAPPTSMLATTCALDAVRDLPASRA